MLRTHLALLAFAGFCAAGTAAVAADVSPSVNGQGALSPSRFYVHVGPSYIIPSTSAKVRAGGQIVPGGDLNVETQVTPSLTVGYYFTSHIAIAFTGGVPPLAKVVGAGTLSADGVAGKVRYGPTTLMAEYHFDGLGPLRPYVGLGPVLMPVFADHDGVVSHLHTHGNVGFGGGGGADLMFSRHLGVYFDVKKAILGTESTGFLGPYPIDAKIRLNPLVLSSGLSYRF